MPALEAAAGIAGVPPPRTPHLGSGVGLDATEVGAALMPGAAVSAAGVDFGALRGCESGGSLLGETGTGPMVGAGAPMLGKAVAIGVKGVRLDLPIGPTVRPEPQPYVASCLSLSRAAGVGVSQTYRERLWLRGLGRPAPAKAPCGCLATPECRQRRASAICTAIK